MPKIKQLEKELKALEKIEQKRLMKVKGKQREHELKIRIQQLKYRKLIEARERAAVAAGKIGAGVRRAAKVGGEALRKLQEREKRLEELERKKRKARKGKRPPREETSAERLEKVLGF